MKKYSYAFTLIELLVVITIISILVGLLFPVVGSVRLQAQKAVASANNSSIVIAVNQYQTDYGLFPPEEFQANAGDENKQIMNILRAEEGENAEHNPRKTKYLQGKDAKAIGEDRFRDGFTEDGEYLDPWTYSYGVKWDADYDGETELPTTGGGQGDDNTVDLDVIAWSVGKDGDAGTDDDVTSWD